MSFVQKFSTGLVVNQIAWLARGKHKVQLPESQYKSNCFDKDKAIILGPKTKATGWYLQSWQDRVDLCVAKIF